MLRVVYIGTHWEKFAEHLASKEQYSRSFVLNCNGSLPSGERCKEMMKVIIDFGKEGLIEPTGGGTVGSEADPDWKEDSFVDNPVADNVRECFRVYRMWERQLSDTDAAKKQRAANEENAKNWRNQAKEGHRSPPPKVCTCAQNCL